MQFMVEKKLQHLVSQSEIERSGKARVADQTADTTERASTLSSICLSDP
jgi:hypothetical protein